MVTYTQPREYASGFSNRQASDLTNADLMARIETVVLDYHAWDIWPTSMTPSSSQVAQIQADINTVKTTLGPTGNGKAFTGNPYHIVLRVRFGIWCPDWMKTACGGAVRFWDDSGWGDADFAAYQGNPAPSTVGATNPAYEFTKGLIRTWDSRWYADGGYYDQCQQFLASQFGTQVAEVDCCPAATHFNEPILRQFGVQENLDAQIAAGWTEALDDACFAAGWQQAARYWVPKGVGVTTSYNPAGVVIIGSPNKYQPSKNLARTYRLQDQQKSILGPFGLIMNRSFDQTFTVSPTATASYEQQMWGHMAAMSTQTPYQTATLGKLKSAGGSFTSVCQAAVAAKAMRIELPLGVQTFSSSSGDAWYVTPTADSAHPNATRADVWSPQIKYQAARESVPTPPSTATVISGGSGTSSNTSWVSSTLPATVKAGARLALMVAAGTSGSLVTAITINGRNVLTAPVSGNPDGSGTTLATWIYDIALLPADGGQAVTVTMSANTKGGMVGVYVEGGQFSALSIAAYPNAGSGVMPTIGDPSWSTIEFVAARQSTGATTITLPTQYAPDVSYGTSTSSGYGVALVAGADVGTGGGSFSTSLGGTPADKATTYTLGYARYTPSIPLLTATPIPDGFPRVAVEISGFSNDGPMPVYRQHIGWGDPTLYPVRSMPAVSGGASFAYDYEAPFNVDIQYSTMDGTTQITSEPTQLNVDVPWISVPGLPAYSLALEVIAKPQVNRSRPLGVLSPYGAAMPVALSDTRKAASFTVQVRARTSDAADTVDDILDHAPVALLRIPGVRQAWQYVAIGASGWTPAVAYRSTGAPGNVGEWETCSLDCTVVAQPIGGVFGDPSVSWQSVINTYPTWQDVLNANSTWVDVLRGVGS